MRVAPWAEVYTPQTHPHIAEHCPPTRPVPTLAELVERFGGYTFTLDLEIPDKAAAWMSRVAEATGDAELAAVIARGYVEGSLEHLRHLDHTATHVVHGWQTIREPTDPPELWEEHHWTAGPEPTT